MEQPIYIVAQKSDWSGPVQKIVDEIFFGPFDVSEEHLRVNDAYADNLEADGFEVYSTYLPPDEVATVTVNPREFWMSQLATVSFIQEVVNA